MALSVASIAGPTGARRLEVAGKGNKSRSIPIDPALENVFAAYQSSRAARFPDHNFDHPTTPLLVNTRGRRMAAHQMRYLIERLYTRAGIRARIPSGAMVHALRHSFATDALQAGAHRRAPSPARPRLPRHHPPVPRRQRRRPQRRHRGPSQPNRPPTTLTQTMTGDPGPSSDAAGIEASGTDQSTGQVYMKLWEPETSRVNESALRQPIPYLSDPLAAVTEEHLTACY